MMLCVVPKFVMVDHALAAVLDGIYSHLDRLMSDDLFEDSYSYCSG